MDRKVAQIGWFEGNEQIPMVLVSLRDRAEIQCEKGSMVKVSHKVKGKAVTIIAIVDKQFRELLGKASINQKAAEALSAKKGDTISIVGGVTESEAAAFKQQYAAPNPIAQIMARLAAQSAEQEA